ncbi:hypothetical protein CMI47_09630 [Candidatus Pacearchaeota archaeon]|nr:hypothetical protein [Candidatus Pacearchaeota archaeon]|tara:strand:- start:94 stop:342 length:249 start_codon:yes stop_codon:yes gene_type:complete
MNKTLNEYNDMSISNKYFIELNVECVLESDEDKKEVIIDKMNKAISKILKDEKAVHLIVNINLISENSLMASLSSINGGEEN